MPTDDTFDDPASVARRIEATFSALDFDTWKTCFDPPCRFVSPTGGFVLDHATTEDDFPLFALLQARGFARTRLDRTAVRMITDTTALVDTAFTRLKTDGSELERLGALYLCRLTDEGWTAYAVAGHAHDEPVIE